MRVGLVLMLLAVAGTAHADTLGRLFHTPEQRALLDAARRAAGSGGTTAATGPGLEVSGLVTRSDGRRTTWINGRAEHGQAERKGDHSGVRLRLPSGEVDLKVGQVLDPATGTVEEAYRRPPKPKPAPAEDKPPSSAPNKPAPTEREHADAAEAVAP